MRECSRSVLGLPRLLDVTAPVAAPPYALASTGFAFPALAALAARAPIGGQRETVLACLVVARLVSAVAPPSILTIESLRERAEAARAWLGTHQLPQDVRGRLGQTANATGSGDATTVAAELEALVEAAGDALDAPSKAELARLITRLRS